MRFALPLFITLAVGACASPASHTSASRPANPMSEHTWVNRTEYPFRSRYFDTGAGRMHYVDEGQGQPVLLVHGTPTWSFLYRHLIWGLSTQGYRVIAVDHLGFGLSDKPEGAAYRPADHSRRLAALVEHLRLSQVDLVVHDFGGPIALGYATEHPENVRRIVLFNTWMWSLAENRSTVRASGFAAGPIGRFLYRRMNFSPKVLMKAVMGDKSRLTPEAHRHYVQAFPDASARMAPWVLARELIGSSEWYDGLWARRDRLRGKPALLLWGMKDPTFGPDALARWQEALPQAETERFPNAGHFVQEEEGAALVPRIDAFLRSAAPAR